jgi:hypothetical protein
MSGLVLELQSDCLNPNIDTSNLLRKALAVSKKLELGDMEEFFKHELFGYPETSDIPEFRKLKGLLKTHNPIYGSKPLIALNNELAKQFEEISSSYTRQPIGELSSLLDNEKGTLIIAFPLETANTLMNMMDVPDMPVLEIPSSQISRILDSVRSKILEWSLELEKRGVKGEGMEFSKQEKEKADSSSMIINLIGSMTDSQLQQNSHGSTQSMNLLEDIQAFLKELKEKYKELQLSEELKKELEADITTIENQTNSPKPKSIIINESLKSIRNILEGASGSLIAAGLQAQFAHIFFESVK